MDSAGLNGHCACIGVRYEAAGPFGPVLACHCSICARTSGNYATMTSCEFDKLVLKSAETLSWYRSTPEVERGFCNRCGGNLFWRQIGSSTIYITAGTLNAPTGLKVAEHIFVNSKSDFYQLTDGLPQKTEW